MDAHEEWVHEVKSLSCANRPRWVQTRWVKVKAFCLGRLYKLYSYVTNMNN